MCIDLYTAAMEHCLGELPEAGFRTRATNALRQLIEIADPDYLRLHFKQLTSADIARFERRQPGAGAIAVLVDRLVATFKKPGYDLYTHKHSGFKDYTEGPDASTPIFLRQDAYKALSEPVKFRNPDGTTTDTTHTARFGEIEQRFFAATPTGRALYNRCADAAEAGRKTELADTDHAAFLASYAEHFAPFPKNLRALLKAGLAYGVYTPTAKGLAAKGAIRTTDIHELLEQGYVEVEGIRYEDFLPVSAAGIFASNLNQYGTKATAASRPDFPQSRLEAIIGRPIIDADAEYRDRQEASIAKVREALGLRA
jgi:uncharacterized glyoxalase superfamily metalloenzyme YdcJ